MMEISEKIVYIYSRFLKCRRKHGIECIFVNFLLKIHSIWFSFGLNGLKCNGNVLKPLSICF